MASESQSSRHVWQPKEEGQANATICCVGNATGKKHDPVYHNEGADHPASDAGEKAGQKRISHKFKLESFKHSSIPLRSPKILVLRASPCMIYDFRFMIAD
jgi:hypothetical protein